LSVLAVGCRGAEPDFGGPGLDIDALGRDDTPHGPQLGDGEEGSPAPEGPVGPVIAGGEGPCGEACAAAAPTHRIGISGDSACAVDPAGALKCWGSNSWGQLGDGSIDRSQTPVSVLSIANVAGVSLSDGGGGHACAHTTASELFCWGSNTTDELGLGDTTFIGYSYVPKKVAFTNVRSVVAGSRTTCAVTHANELYCWGDNRQGRLLVGHTGDVSSPTKVQFGEPVADIALGYEHACLRTTTGDVYCWGKGANGLLGLGSEEDAATPTKLAIANVVSLSANQTHTCAAVASGDVYCWGHGMEGQLGHGGTGFKWLPNKVNGVSDVVQVTTGMQFTIVRTRAGDLYSWGYNTTGQLATAPPGYEKHPSPEKVTALVNVVDVVAGGMNACAQVAGDPSTYCWGHRDRLGVVATNHTNIPTKVF